MSSEGWLLLRRVARPLSRCAYDDVNFDYGRRTEYSIAQTSIRTDI
jgi:hypothetical protein